MTREFILYANNNVRIYLLQSCNIGLIEVSKLFLSLGYYNI